MAGFLGSGKVYYDRIVSGVNQGWVFLGNTTKFEIKENAEFKERPSRIKGSYGQVLDSVAVKQPAEFSINTDDISPENLSLIWLGSDSALSVTGSTVSDEAVTAHLGKMFQTAQMGISSVVIQDVTDTTTYVLDTDYSIINADMGLIEVLAGGSISEDDVLHVDYTYATIAGTKVQGGTESSVKAALLLDGENFADQSDVRVNVWEAVLKPESGVDILAEDFANIDLSGSMNTPTGKASAYEIDMNIVQS